MRDEDLWKAILERNRSLDGRMVYAVRSTGVYCRPSCSSKKPKYEQVLFFSRPELAEQAGFRPCRRCRPDRPAADDPKLVLARKVCRYIEAHLEDQLSLRVLSQHFALSPAHLQRSFTHALGISPREYAETCRMNRIRGDLRKGASIMSSLYDAGYGSSSQLYERADAHLGMSPGTYQDGARGAHVTFATRRCSLGFLLVAATERGICAVQLGNSPSQLEEQLRKDFPQAEIERASAALRARIGRVLGLLEGKVASPALPLDVDIQGTAFQRRVWLALQKIPHGSTRSYAQIAKAIGQPKAARAVGRACAANRLALLIPCHRAIPSHGGVGAYRWGARRKRAILAREKRQALKSLKTAEQS
jgi:AraC family transcriptional regulator of adaptative response/methylated-DNA-[protein]-cysteine methyltransferase